MLKALLVAAVLLVAAEAEALQATYTWTAPTDPNRTGIRVERRDGPDTASWVAQGPVLPAGQTSFNQANLVLGTRYCYRVIAVGLLGDAAPNTTTGHCGTPDSPLPLGGGVLIFSQ
jgi:hypothetical protein